MYILHLQAVDSRIATAAEQEAAAITPAEVPPNMQVLAHQAATIAALRTGNAQIVINRAMTGDGKTLAGRWLLFNDKKRSFAMYPTNELAHDQARSFNELLDSGWQPSAWKRNAPIMRTINAQEIDDFSFGEDIDFNRAEVISHLLKNDYVLTNPDIFHLIMNFAYQQAGVAQDFLPTRLAERFPLFVFDEFHLFGVEQSASVLIAMLLLRRMTGTHTPPRFLFLSATPQALLTELANKVGLGVTSISGEYAHGNPLPPHGYRRILQPVNLHLHTGQIETWVQEHVDDIIGAFFNENHPTAKGIIIVNSVATAQRIYGFLKRALGARLHIGINTGITPKQDRSRSFDLLVATSTVDVGVDFKINFLVFESLDAASHQQRLGRLGRHAYDDQQRKFDVFEAHALLPAWTVEGLQQAFADGASINREAYKATLDEHYTSLQQFDSYIYRWAGVQAGKVLQSLNNKHIRTQYRSVNEMLLQEYQQLFGRSVKKFWALHQEKQHKTLEAATSFRGGSVFTALVQDPENGSGRIVSYNLMTLLRHAAITAVPLEDMFVEASKRQQQLAPLKKTQPLAAYRISGWLEQPRDVTFRLDAELPEERKECVIEQDRFAIECVGVPELRLLNKYLDNNTYVAFIIPDKSPDLVRRILRLGYQLELFNLKGLGGLSGTVTFGRNALLIDSVLFRRRKTDESFIW